MADTLFFFWEIFLHDLILPPGGIKSEFIMREILIGRKSKSKVQVKRIKYRAQNEAYMCRSAKNAVIGLCFSVLSAT